MNAATNHVERTLASDGNTSAANARFVLRLMLIAIVCVFACLLVASRDIDVGTDTRTYAEFFLAIGHGPVVTRLEPGFVTFTELLRFIGFSVTAYQAALFVLLLSTVLISTRKYFHYLDMQHGYLLFLSASLMLLFFSPMFVNASINTVRQGISSLLVFTALLAFYQRQWWQFVFYGVLASSLHYSSLLFLVFAPILLLGTRMQRVIAAGAFVVYCSGLSVVLVQALSPTIYTIVMDYSANATFRAGTRLDFAVFSIFWYLLPHVAAPFVKAEAARKIKQAMAVYTVLLLPFFAIGFGNFSNRYLLPAWLAASLVIAAILCNSRIALLRHPSFIQAGLVASVAAFYYYVTHMVII
jgi:hypothetical protein